MIMLQKDRIEFGTCSSVQSDAAGRGFTGVSYGLNGGVIPN